MSSLISKLAIRGLVTLAAAGLCFTAHSAEPAALTSAVPPAHTLPVTTVPIPGPQIVFTNPVYDFGKVNAGETVKCIFVFTNAGDDTLTITGVHPSCGCTAMGEWSRQVEPGQTGTIPLQLATTGLGGPVAKTVTVTSNDKARPSTILQIKGTIWKAIDFSPPYAVLNVTPDSAGASVTVNITNNTDVPLVLSEPQVNNPSFTAQLSTNEPGKSFKLAISTVATNTGSVQGIISLKTSSTNLPVISITAWANVQPAVSVIPPSINLPPAPLPNRLTPIVTFINNTTNPVAFSDATVTIDGVDVQFREVQKGRYFTATLAFPQGFEVTQGQPAEFTIKSTHPKYPLIKVPISQPPKPKATPQPQPQQATAAPALTPPVVAPPSTSPAPIPTPAARPPQMARRPAPVVPPMPITPSPSTNANSR